MSDINKPLGKNQGPGSQVKVFFRFRPMDKLEISKRSKDCIELHDNPKIVTIDSPLLGVSDFTFDQVFDEYAPQEEVFKESVSMVPRKILEGINCTVIAYGQSGTGKTHTMLGENLGVELNERAKQTLEVTSDSRSQSDLSKNPDMTEGMIPRVVDNIFKQMVNSPDTVEYIVRCSYVEIYLEKLRDLLQPWREDIWIGNADNGDACIIGASELCCVEPRDIYALLARGNAYRTKAATDQNIDSSRSHAIFSLRLEQIDRTTGKQKSSRLQMVDLAGSELGRQKSSKALDSQVALEGKMINASLGSFNNLIRATVSLQGKGKGKFNPRSVANSSKLAKLMRPAFGSTTFTTIICTGSPSSYNIHETINTIKFGQQARQVTNYPVPHVAFTVNAYRARITDSEKRNKNLTTLVKMLAQECKSLKVDAKQKSPDTSQIWNVVNKITDHDQGEENNVQISLSVTLPGEDDCSQVIVAKTAQELETELGQCKLAKEKAESALRDSRSDITALRRQNELISQEKELLERELFELKDEMKKIGIQKSEMEHRLRTSQFREREAILFLRQFRTFYFRLLKSKAAHGNGSTKDITDDVSKKIPGISDLSDLLDVDKVMMQSGIIEKEDVGMDTNSQDYAPSREALSKSSDEAEKAEAKEFELIRNMQQMDAEATGGSRVSITNSKNPAEFTYGQLTSYRQKLLESPAGRLAMQKEHELEYNLTELAKKCVTLQNSVMAEKAMVEALSARQGAMGKMKSAQELNTLRQELDRKTNDLHAIVWKMNELHLVNKTIDTKVENREQHVTRLEEHVANLQAKNRRLVVEKQETERRLKEDNQGLKNQIDGLAVKVWQLGDIIEGKPYPWRSIVPYNGEPVDLTRTEDEQRRMSLGTLGDEELEGLVQMVSIQPGKD